MGRVALDAPMVAVVDRRGPAPAGSLNIIRGLRRDFRRLPACPLGSGQMVRQLALAEEIAGSPPASPATPSGRDFGPVSACSFLRDLGRRMRRARGSPP